MDSETQFVGYAFESLFFNNTFDFWAFNDEGPLTLTEKSMIIEGTSSSVVIDFNMISSLKLVLRDPGMWKTELIVEDAILVIMAAYYLITAHQFNIVEIIFTLAALIGYFYITFISYFRTYWIQIDFINPDPVPTIFLSVSWGGSMFTKFWKHRIGGILTRQNNERLYAFLSEKI